MRRGEAFALAGLLACGTPSGPAPGEPTAALGGATVAVAGAVPIDRDLVAAVARKTGQTPERALDALLFDAVLAQGAAAQKLDRSPEVREAQRALRARLVADRLFDAARARGAPTDEEVAELTARHWREVDLPEQARVVHAVVMIPKSRTPRAPAETAVLEKRRRAVAEALHAAVLGARDATDFVARAKLVDAEGLEIKPEVLPTFVADGRVVEGDGRFDDAFVGAAFALAPGRTSGVVETRFGLHVIRMLERLPPKRVSLEERRARFADETFAMRARAAYVALLDRAKQRSRVAIDPAADALMASAPVQ